MHTASAAVLRRSEADHHIKRYHINRYHGVKQDVFNKIKPVGQREKDRGEKTMEKLWRIKMLCSDGTSSTFSPRTFAQKLLKRADAVSEL